ncbi:hypothetical protein SAMN05192575_1175 [Nocardioides alpinus]|uniref:Uncharacterized protein n=1 Tax=Nocardioides alpinus TaxID=748909 RepID=A0A1I1BD59_9ACTN|nr:hypothetical protein [Nocardioides alpinus]PKH38461.1 hypothetical protein CXG46_15555 [Nocardioides alpinus]SFB48299.1 hypothetical protein SAMN05192575_1175 [Nocardioides alpinus]
MAWDWIAPTGTAVVGLGGIFFTWWSGAQGRAHAERVVRLNQHVQDHARILKEKRDAYLAALENGELESHRRRYAQKGRQDKLDKLEETFPKGERVRMSIKARAGLEAFGSEEVRGLVERWREAGSAGDHAELEDIYARLREQMRAELGESFDGPSSRTRRQTADGRTGPLVAGANSDTAKHP